MRALIKLQQKLYPNILETIQQRYSVLNGIKVLQPIGRRGLAENIHLTERTVRSEVTFLHKEGYINVTPKGMYVTKEGNIVLEQLADFIREISGINILEKQLKEALQLKEVIVVSGNSDKFSWIQTEMGKECVKYLQTILEPNSIISVTGGSTIAAVADTMVPLSERPLFVPARGGLGEKVENQANTIVAKMATRAKGDYRLLYVPDPLSESSYETMINEPAIIDILNLIKGSNIVIHSIGDALTMAKRRKTKESVIEKLTKEKAVSEAFGYYFDKDGKIVHTVRTIGLQLKDLTEDKRVITIAGGKSKAEAIVSYFKRGKRDVFITDEEAAKEILEGYTF